MVPQSFAVGGNRSYPEFWAITGGPWYPGYITMTVAPEPYVEQVAGADHSMVGRTYGTVGTFAGLDDEIAWLKPPRS
jgi:hypothetical protein